jgi:hypothetical protein
MFGLSELLTDPKYTQIQILFYIFRGTAAKRTETIKTEMDDVRGCNWAQNKEARSESKAARIIPSEKKKNGHLIACYSSSSTNTNTNSAVVITETIASRVDRWTNAKH